MPTFGGYNNQQGYFDGGLSHLPSSDEFLNQLATDLRWLRDRQLAVENFIGGGAGSSLVDLLGGAGTIIAGGAAGGPGGIVAGTALAALKLLEASHGQSNLTGWIANALDPDILGAEEKPTGHLTRIGHDAAAAAAAGALAATNTTTLINQGVQVSPTLPADVARAVWLLTGQFGDSIHTGRVWSMIEIMGKIFSFAQSYPQLAGFPLPSNPQFTLYAPDMASAAYSVGHWGDLGIGKTLPHIAPSTGRAAGGLLDTLAAEIPGLLWAMVGPDTDDNPSPFAWAKLSEQQDAWIRFNTPLAEWSAPPPPVVSSGGGLYPGRDRTRVLLEQEFDSSFGIELNMQGVNVRIDSTAPKQGRYVESHSVRLPYLGWLNFFDDQGDVDEIQRIEYSSSVFIPKRLQWAAGVDIFVKPLTSGSVQCWSIIE